MGNRLIILFVLICSSSFALAGSASEDRLVDRLTTITGSSIEELVAPAVEQYSNTLARNLVKNKPSLPPEAVPVVADEIRVYLHEQILINKEMKSLKYELYEKYFSEDELRSLIAFYKSPLGQKLLAVTPKMMSDISRKSQKVILSIQKNLIENIGPRLNKRMRENGW